MVIEKGLAGADTGEPAMSARRPVSGGNSYVAKVMALL